METVEGEVVDTTIYKCDCCGEYDRRVLSYYWSKSGDILQQSAHTGTKHVCEPCLTKFVDAF